MTDLLSNLSAIPEGRKVSFPTFLVWQNHSNDARHLRKIYYRPVGDRLACCFAGFEKQNEAALKWIADVGDPEWENRNDTFDAWIRKQTPYSSHEVML